MRMSSIAASTRLSSAPSVASTTRWIVWPAQAASERRGGPGGVVVRRRAELLEHDRRRAVLGLDDDRSASSAVEVGPWAKE